MYSQGKKKVSWVSDNIHGSMPMSSLDMALVATETFNRLHNVLQNSTLQYTFPANRTSRFIHSLGCAHLAGRMFQSSIRSSAEDVLCRFMEAFRQNLAAIDDLGMRDAGRISAYHEDLRKEDSSKFIDPFYKAAVPGGLSESYRYLYIILYQAIRFAGLLHDIGHPPFSHVVERGLTEVSSWLKEKPNGTTKNKELVEQMEKTGKVLHEGLGQILAERILDDLYSEIDERELKFRFDFLRIKNTTLSILKKTTPFFKGLGMIISGTFDADRLDYISRDSVMCGLRRAPIENSRLIESFHLLQNGEGDFVFGPSTRCLSTIEEIFRRRFNVYKYAIFHHRVVKFDYLMQACVVELAKMHLDNLDNATGTHDGSNRDGLLRDNIGGLWEIFNVNTLNRIWEQRNAFIQWDDAWLWSVLRRHYFLLQREQQKNQNLFYKLQELLSNKKQYHSIIKRPDSFMEIERAFVEAIPDYVDANSAKFDWTISTGLPKEIADVLEAEFAIARDHIKKEESVHGFFLSRLYESFDLFGREIFGKKLLENACGQVVKDGLAAESFFVRKEIKAGVKADFCLANSDGIVRIGTFPALFTN